MKLTLNIEQKPQSRPRFTKFGKAYDTKEMKAWRKLCSYLVKAAWGRKEQLKGPLKAAIRFLIDPPEYIKKVKKNRQALLDETMPVGKKPDLDNYEKALYDSMTDIAYKDDGQIALHNVGKFYSLNPRIEVEIEELE